MEKTSGSKKKKWEGNYAAWKKKGTSHKPPKRKNKRIYHGDAFFPEERTLKKKKKNISGEMGPEGKSNKEKILGERGMRSQFMYYHREGEGRRLQIVEMKSEESHRKGQCLEVQSQSTT